MAVQILIPLKPLAIAKQRLAPVLAPDERRRLMISMLEHVCRQAVAAQVGPVALATSEPNAGLLAERLGVDVLSDGGLPWNDGLRHALRAASPGPRGVLYLSADLPLATSAEITRLVHGQPDPGAVIGRAHDGGTNALAVWPADAFTPAFGEPASAELHRLLAERAGLPSRTLDLPGIALDVDTPQDVVRAATAVAG
ncbi:MAG: 2-phospho-L-lactate guanylyltransferase [Gaiellales bacterium]